MPKIVYATTDSDEEDYARKLQQAQTAIQEAEEARLKMLQKKKKSVGSIPLLTRCKISKTDAGTLQIDIQPEGIKSSSLFSGAFSVAWFSAIIPATFAGGGPGGALFLLPFWMAGGLVAKTALVDPFVSGTLAIGQYAWTLQGKYAKSLTVKTKEGPTSQLKGCTVEQVIIVNGIPQFELRLFGEKGMAGIGLGLPLDELEYLAGEINDFLSNNNTNEDEDHPS